MTATTLHLQTDNLPSPEYCRGKMIWGSDECLAGATDEMKAFVEKVNKPECFVRLDKDFIAHRINCTEYSMGHDLIASAWHLLREMHSSWTD